MVIALHIDENHTMKALKIEIDTLHDLLIAN